MKHNQKHINENLNLIPLNTTSYSNLTYDKDGTQNDSVNKPLLDDIHAAAKSVGIVATITVAKTGHGKMVKGGKSVSRHMNGTGVDVSILNGIGAGGATNSSNGNDKFRELGNKLKDALVSMGYVWNSESGNDKAVLWQTNTGGNHYNHLHISNKSGESSEDKLKDSPMINTTGPTVDNGTNLNLNVNDVESSDIGSGQLIGSLIMNNLKEEIVRIKQLMK